MEKIIEAISELILSNQAQTKAIAIAAKKQADASWMLAEKYAVEFNEQMKRPFWKKILGL